MKPSPCFSVEQVIRTLEEPTAAALAFGLHRKPNVNHILVYDLGGGTLDVSLLFVNDGSVEVLGSDGDDNLGGETAVVNEFMLCQGNGTNLDHMFSRNLRSHCRATLLYLSVFPVAVRVRLRSVPDARLGTQA